MSLFDEMTEDNLIIFAAKNYYNPKCIDAEEFYEDLNRFKYIKRLVNRYLDTNKISERLILNHLIVIFNVFGVPTSLKMLELKLDHNQWKVIKPFLIFLKYIQNDHYIGTDMDKKVIEKLRGI
jgi:hypothetical protein